MSTTTISTLIRGESWGLISAIVVGVTLGTTSGLPVIQEFLRIDPHEPTYRSESG